MFLWLLWSFLTFSQYTLYHVYGISSKNVALFLTGIKEIIILALIKMVRKTLFKTTAKGVSREGREISSEYGNDSRRFIAKVQSKGVSGWKTWRGGRGEVLAKLGQQDSC